MSDGEDEEFVGSALPMTKNEVRYVHTRTRVCFYCSFVCLFAVFVCVCLCFLFSEKTIEASKYETAQTGKYLGDFRTERGLRTYGTAGNSKRFTAVCFFVI